MDRKVKKFEVFFWGLKDAELCESFNESHSTNHYSKSCKFKKKLSRRKLAVILNSCGGTS
jgi:hypothetical protein